MTNPCHLCPVSRLPHRLIVAAAAIAAFAYLPTLRAGETAPTTTAITTTAAAKRMPPRLSVLMGLAQDWQARGSRAHDGTLLDIEDESDLLPADIFATFGRVPRRAAVASFPEPNHRAEVVRAETARREDAPVTLPEPDRPADYAASGFAPRAAAITAAPAYTHAAFAADMLAAPARAHIASELRGDWMGHLDDARTSSGFATVAADRAPQSFATPAWTTSAPGASFASAVSTRAISTTSFTPIFPADRSLPAAIDPIPAAVGVSGTAYAWGYNLNGQVGNGTTTNQTSPTAVQGLPGGGNVTAVSSGAGQTLYVVNGAVYVSGNAASGQLGNGGTTGNSGNNQTTATPASVLTSGVTNVASGYTQCLAIQNGALYTWGSATNGVLGNGTSTGNVTTPTAVSGYGSGVTLIAGNQNNSYVVRNGALFACGANSVGEIGNGTIQPNTTLQTTFTATTLTSGVTSVSTGQAHVLAIQNGALYAWGFNTSGQLGNGTFYNGNGPGGTNGNPTPTVVLGLGTGVTSASAGYNHSLAVMNGNVYAWGNNQTGQLGTGSTLPSGTYQTTAIQIDPTDLKNILQVVAGDYSSYALAADGSLYVWGRNQAGQLGLGDTVERDSPTHLLAPTGFYYSALSADGSGGAGFGDVVGILTAGTAPAVVPEPGTWAGGALLLVAAGWTLRRRLGRQGAGAPVG